jgi:hypothetical protein
MVAAVGMSLTACIPSGPSESQDTNSPTTSPDSNNPADSATDTGENPTPTSSVFSSPTVTCTWTPTSEPSPTPLQLPTKTRVFGGSTGNVHEPGPDPISQKPAWIDGVDEVVRYPGSKKEQVEMVDMGVYKDPNLIIIGYSTGGDTAMMFAY